MRRAIFIFGLVLILVFLVLVSFGYDLTISRGDFQGLRLGMRKSDVIAELARRGVLEVMPEVDEHIVVSKTSIRRLSELEKAEGVCIGDNSGLDLQVSFDSQDMSHVVYRSKSADLSELGIQTSQSRKYVMERIEAILLSRNDMSISNCILDVKVIPLQSDDPVHHKNLDRFDSWFYYIPNSYSAATLRFADGKLVKVIYHWRPFEGP